MIKTLSEWMTKLGIYEEDIIEKFILGAGSGGQKINKSSTCVYLRHIPTGIEVKCQKSRAREENRELARKILCEKVEEMQKQKIQQTKAAVAKKRRQNRKRSPHQKEKLVETKRKTSAKKQLRQKTLDDA